MSYKYPDAAILVFCKAPIAWQVKTRLIPQLSPQQAAALHVELSKRVLSLVSVSNLCPIQLWCSPDIEHPFFQECTEQYPLSLHTQQGNDLGERMHHAIDTALHEKSKVLLIGCDSPSITAEDLDLALQSLQTPKDITLAPAEDGGYVMIGMREPQPELFLDMEWGNSHVLKATYQRVANAGLIRKETKQQWDIDTFADLKRYRQVGT